MLFVSPLEKRLFRLAAICLLLIYASLYVARPIAEFLRDHNLLRVTVAVCFLTAAALVVVHRHRAGAGPAEWFLIVAFAALYVLLLLRLEVPEERFHLLEYGLFGGLVYAALRERRRALSESGSAPGRWPPAVVAVLVTVAAGWVDEGIQGILPTRYYDLRDVVLNGLAGLLAVAFMAAVHRLRSAREI